MLCKSFQFSVGAVFLTDNNAAPGFYQALPCDDNNNFGLFASKPTVFSSLPIVPRDLFVNSQLSVRAFNGS